MAKAKPIKKGFKKLGDKVVKKRMTAAERKKLSRKIQKEDFPKEKPANKHVARCVPHGRDLPARPGNAHLCKKRASQDQPAARRQLNKGTGVGFVS